MVASALREKIAAIENQMKAKLQEARATFAHPVDKGTSIEVAFRRFLTEYLARRLAVGYGEVIDGNGRRSGQTDVVIANEDHPFTFTPDAPGIFFIEGVSAAGEVKTLLTSDGLEKAFLDAKKFKQLEIDPGPGTHIFTNEADRERFYRCPPWFLIEFESQMELGTIASRISDLMTKETLEFRRVMDAVFVLGKGWVINFGNGEGSFKFVTPNGTSVPGWVYQASDAVLFDFLGWLSTVMPRMVRFWPILPKYMVQGA